MTIETPIRIGWFSDGTELFRIGCSNLDDRRHKDMAGFQLTPTDELWIRFRPSDGAAMPEGSLFRERSPETWEPHSGDLQSLRAKIVAVARAVDFDRERIRLSIKDPASSVRVISNVIVGGSLGRGGVSRVLWPIPVPDEWVAWTNRPQFRWPALGREARELMQYIGESGPNTDWFRVSSYPNVSGYGPDHGLLQLRASVQILPITSVKITVRQTDQSSPLNEPPPIEWVLGFKPQPTLVQAVEAWLADQGLVRQSQYEQWWVDNCDSLELEEPFRSTCETYQLLGLSNPLLLPFDQFLETFGLA